MVHWNSSSHPISDIRDWNGAGRLELRPDFQRREVWSAPARIMLVDTILRDIPMPKIFLANTIREGNTYRIVIDGQQRISAILAFLRGEFSLAVPYCGDEHGKHFSELDKDVQIRFLSYQIDFNEAVNPPDSEVREVYARVNKYAFPLTKQELRRADFPGDFLSASEKLSITSYFDSVKIFTPANRRRYADVEYVSELLATMIGGIQDKKQTLDDFYIEYADWDGDHKSQILGRFSTVLGEIELIFGNGLSISGTRFRQKADFYSLFTAIDELVSKGHTVKGKKIGFLRSDFKTLEDHIRPESDIEICSSYAIKCVSQANSASSRRWRHRFLGSILAGTYIGKPPDKFGAGMFYQIKHDSSICPESVLECPICNKVISDDFSDCVLAWPISSVKQIGNARWAHQPCIKEQGDWLAAQRATDGQQTLL